MHFVGVWRGAHRGSRSPRVCDGGGSLLHTMTCMRQALVSRLLAVVCVAVNPLEEAIRGRRTACFGEN